MSLLHYINEKQYRRQALCLSRLLDCVVNVFDKIYVAYPYSVPVKYRVTVEPVYSGKTMKY